MQSNRLQALFLVFALTGCTADKPLNPSFPLLLDDAKVALKEMTAEPKELDRPLVILSGIYDPGFVAPNLADKFRKFSHDDRIISVSFFLENSFDKCRDRVIEKVQDVFGSDNPGETIEVDVIAISMGGLVARHAALPRTDGKPRLKIHRLFTIGTPHRGARLAGLPSFDRRVMDMRAGSDFLRRLDQDLQNHPYEIVAYVRLGDGIVGPENASPAGEYPYWVANKPGSFSHIAIMYDDRFHADILRRLRGEAPFTSASPAPFPDTTTDES